MNTIFKIGLLALSGAAAIALGTGARYVVENNFNGTLSTEDFYRAISNTSESKKITFEGSLSVSSEGGDPDISLFSGLGSFFDVKFNGSTDLSDSANPKFLSTLKIEFVSQDDDRSKEIIEVEARGVSKALFVKLAQATIPELKDYVNKWIRADVADLSLAGQPTPQTEELTLSTETTKKLETAIKNHPIFFVSNHIATENIGAIETNKYQLKLNKDQIIPAIKEIQSVLLQAPEFADYKSETQTDLVGLEEQLSMLTEEDLPKIFIWINNAKNTITKIQLISITESAPLYEDGPITPKLTFSVEVVLSELTSPLVVNVPEEFTSLQEIVEQFFASMMDVEYGENIPGEFDEEEFDWTQFESMEEF